MTITLQLLFFLNVSSAKRESCALKNLEWKPGEKPPNPMRETEKENWGKMRTF